MFKAVYLQSGEDKKVRVWNTDDGMLLHELELGEATPTSVAVLPSHAMNTKPHAVHACSRGLSPSLGSTIAITTTNRPFIVPPECARTHPSLVP